MKTISIETILNRVNQTRANSAWSRGVKLYAADILNNIIDEGQTDFIIGDDGFLRQNSWTIHCLSHGFDMWVSISRGSSYMIFNRDIAERLCTPSEFRRAEKNGFFRANSREDWLDCQGRALYQARNLILDAIKAEIAA